MCITNNHESHYVTVLDNPPTSEQLGPEDFLSIGYPQGIKCLEGLFPGVQKLIR